MTLYPIFLKLDGLRCLVVGGGKVALRKVRDLVDAGAHVVVVAPEFIPELAGMADGVELVRREFEQSDLAGVAIVVAATDSDEVNSRVYREAKARGIWINVVDSPELCDFFLPARAKWKDLEIAVSTLGRSPLASRLIRDFLKESLKDEHLKLVELLSEIRKRLHSQLSDPGQRERFWQRIGALPLVELAEKGEWDRIMQEVCACGLRWSE